MVLTLDRVAESGFFLSQDIYNHMQQQQNEHRNRKDTVKATKLGKTYILHVSIQCNIRQREFKL